MCHVFGNRLARPVCVIFLVFVMLCNKAVTVAVITVKYYTDDEAKRHCNYNDTTSATELHQACVRKTH